MSDSQTILAIERLTVDLPPWADRPRAVDDVSLVLRHDEILCVVGESGSGKSLMARAVLALFPSRHVKPSAGRILYRGEDLLAATPAQSQSQGSGSQRQSQDGSQSQTLAGAVPGRNE